MIPLPIAALVGIGALAMRAITGQRNDGASTTSESADTTSDPAPPTTPISPAATPIQQPANPMTNNSSIPWGDGWMWPVPPARYPNGAIYQPTVSQEYRPVSHLGVDVMYQRNGLADRPEDSPGTSFGTKLFFSPIDTPVCAAKDGVIWSADLSPRGHQIVVDHGKPFATYYQHLTTIAPGMVKGAAVKAGQIIGTMGGDPLDAPQHLRHLHFAVWYNGAGDKASVDPFHEMLSWSKAEPWSAGTSPAAATRFNIAGIGLVKTEGDETV